MVGRLEPVKNHLAILPVVQKLRKQHDFQLLIAGTGYLEERIKAKVRDLHLEDTVKLLGFRTDVPELCYRSHVFLMPSLWEGFPISLLEAGLAKLPVISTPTGSIPDLIDSNTGFLSEISHSEHWMSHTLTNYNDSKTKGELLCMKIIDQFNMDKIASLHEELYEQLLRQNA